METYHIVRFYYPSQKKPAKHFDNNLTLEEAQKHCNNPKTRKEGVYFDGYTKN